MIKPLAETDETVTLSRADYDALLAALEDVQDVAEARRVEARIAAGESEYVPAAMVERLCRGEHPLRVWREHRGLSVEGLAAAIDIAPGDLDAIEAGRETGSIESMRKMARALNVTLDDLVRA